MARAEREWSEDFDAVEWHMRRMEKASYDDYYDEDDH